MAQAWPDSAGIFTSLLCLSVYSVVIDWLVAGRCSTKVSERTLIASGTSNSLRINRDRQEVIGLLGCLLCLQYNYCYYLLHFSDVNTVMLNALQYKLQVLYCFVLPRTIVSRHAVVRIHVRIILFIIIAQYYRSLPLQQHGSCPCKPSGNLVFVRACEKYYHVRWEFISIPKMENVCVLRSFSWGCGGAPHFRLSFNKITR